MKQKNKFDAQDRVIEVWSGVPGGGGRGPRARRRRGGGRVPLAGRVVEGASGRGNGPRGGAWALGPAELAAHWLATSCGLLPRYARAMPARPAHSPPVRNTVLRPCRRRA